MHSELQIEFEDIDAAIVALNLKEDKDFLDCDKQEI